MACDHEWITDDSGDSLPWVEFYTYCQLCGVDYPLDDPCKMTGQPPQQERTTMTNDGTTAEVFRLPDCDICSDGTPASYDSKIKGATAWAYLCQTCYDRVGIGTLGIGLGQRLVVKGADK